RPGNGCKNGSSTSWVTRAGVIYRNSLTRLLTSWRIQEWKELAMKTNANRNYAKLVLVILAVWLGTAIAASRLLVFHAGSTYAFQPPVPLGLAVTLPILAFVLWYATSPGFRGERENSGQNSINIENYKRHASDAPCL